jgi:DHA1 family bicyclomycin/chloramphenicol resistance-like MFS transporter
VHRRRFIALVAGATMLGQFAISTYLPAFSAIAQALGVDSAQVQQSLTAYLLPFALMMPWHGAISDAVGRRRMILLGAGLFALGSLACAAATSIDMLYAGRAAQGFSAGIGVIVGRAMVRDVFGGADAQKAMALVSMVFALAPALAPVAGGLLLLWTGWRSIFIFLSLISAALWLVGWLWLPETLPRSSRHSLHPITLTRAYGEVLANGRFMSLALANATVNVAIYIYVFSAPAFVTRHLGLSDQSFAWLFVPIVLGMLCGSFAAHRVAGRGAPERSVLLGHAVMVLAGVVNIGVNALHAPAMPYALLALPIFSLGMMLTQPGLQLLALDCFPDRRGLASSCFVTMQQLGNSLSSALLVPVLLGSTLYLALGMAALQCTGLLMFWLAGRAEARRAPQ